MIYLQVVRDKPPIFDSCLSQSVVLASTHADLWRCGKHGNRECRSLLYSCWPYDKELASGFYQSLSDIGFGEGK